MTQDPQDPHGAGALSADTVAELERRLADAAAEVAKVQAQLAAARPGGTGAPTTPVAGVPYGATGAGGPQIVFGGGQPVDLSAYLDPQVADRLRASLSHLGLDHQLGAMFGAPPPPPAPAGPLAEPPRPVPFAYRLATFDLSWYELFLIVILTAAPIALWAFLPISVPFGLVAAVLTIAVFRGRRYVRRIGFLKHGKVATVTHREVLSSGTYYSGMTYNNMRKRRANGWDVDTIWYSGPGYTNKVDYTVDGYSGSLVYRGLQYGDGVVLADSRDPSKAICVVEYPYSVKPEPDGRFSGHLSSWQYLGIFITLAVELSILLLAVFAVVYALR